MPFTAEELQNISNSALETYIDRGTVWKQDVANKPMLADLNSRAGKFVGGKEYVSWAVGSGYGGLSLQGYTGDDQLAHGNPTGVKRAKAPWKEHYIGLVVTQTELKTDGIDVVESGSDQRTREMDGREAQRLANIFDEKTDMLGMDYTFSLDNLVHDDGSADAKAMAGVGAIITEVPNVGTTFGISRVTNPWWRNRARTAAYATASGNAANGAIVSSTANGGTLIEFLEAEHRVLNTYVRGGTNRKYYAGSDFIAAYQKELRANGQYSLNGWGAGRGKPDGAMGDPTWNGMEIIYDPTMDRKGQSKRLYIIDMGKTGVRLMYMDGQRMKKHNPARPYDRMVMYQGLSMTGLIIAKQLNTSGVYDIA
jgi:hypothetical protein